MRIARKDKFEHFTTTTGSVRCDWGRRNNAKVPVSERKEAIKDSSVLVERHEKASREKWDERKKKTMKLFVHCNSS